MPIEVLKFAYEQKKERHSNNSAFKSSLIDKSMENSHCCHWFLKTSFFCLKESGACLGSVWQSSEDELTVMCKQHRCENTWIKIQSWKRSSFSFGYRHIWLVLYQQQSNHKIQECFKKMLYLQLPKICKLLSHPAWEERGILWDGLKNGFQIFFKIIIALSSESSWPQKSLGKELKVPMNEENS